MDETNTLHTPAGLLRDPRRIVQQLDSRAGPGGFANQVQTKYSGYTGAWADLDRRHTALKTFD